MSLLHCWKGPGRPQPVQLLEPLVNVGDNGLKKNSLLDLADSHAVPFKPKFLGKANRLASPVPE